MKVIISAGGTGGHIYPALAILDKIKEKEPNSEFLYIGTHNRMEKDIVPKRGIKFESIEIYGLNRKEPLKNFKTVKCLLVAGAKCEKIMKEFKPDVVIGCGGYVTAPVIKAAHKLGIKTVIHEQNSVVGKANLYLTSSTDLVCVSYKNTMNAFGKVKTVFTGNPVSDSARNITKADKTKYGLRKDKKLALFVMGSLGSSKMNDLLIQTMPLFKNKEYEVVFITGKDMYEEISKKKFPSNVLVFPYIENLSSLLKCTDVLISRAGASTISELVALKVPSILVPSPYVTNNHQYKNAKVLEDENACTMIEEKKLESKLLVEKIDELMNDEDKVKEYKNNLKKLDVEDSSLLIYKNIKKLVSRK